MEYQILIKVKPATVLDFTVCGIRIQPFIGILAESAEFPVSLRNYDDNEIIVRQMVFSKEEYDAWNDDTYAEDVILKKLGLERA